MCYFSYSTVERQSVLFMQIASLTGVQIVECERGKRAGQICRKRGRGGEVPSLSHPLPGPLNLLISQPKSYLQDNLIQVFRWWGRRQRSEQEKQQGGGVGGGLSDFTLHPTI